MITEAFLAEAPEDEDDEEIKALMRMHPPQPVFGYAGSKVKHNK